MPTYEYYCDNCNYDFELFQSIKSDSFGCCPKCDKQLERKISIPAGLVFKGSGFYINDYKKSSNSSPTKSSSKTETKSTTETTGKTEAPKTESTEKSVSSKETKPITT